MLKSLYTTATGMKAQQTMVDMIFASPRATQIGVGVSYGAKGMVRYLAHAGRAEPRHRPFEMQATPIASKAMGSGELVQVSHTEGVPHVCVHVPILSAERVMGFFGIGILGRVPIEPWREEVIWATSDLMALLLLRQTERRLALRDDVGADEDDAGGVALVDVARGQGLTGLGAGGTKIRERRLLHDGLRVGATDAEDRAEADGDHGAQERGEDRDGPDGAGIRHGDEGWGRFVKGA